MAITVLETRLIMNTKKLTTLIMISMMKKKEPCMINVQVSDTVPRVSVPSVTRLK